MNCNYDVTIRENIKSYMKQNGLKMSWLAERLEMTRPVLTNKLNGKQPIRLEELENIEKVLNHKFIKITR